MNLSILTVFLLEQQTVAQQRHGRWSRQHECDATSFEIASQQVKQQTKDNCSQEEPKFEGEGSLKLEEKIRKKTSKH
jgi:hypothetical protein